MGILHQLGDVGYSTNPLIMEAPKGGEVGMVSGGKTITTVFFLCGGASGAVVASVLSGSAVLITIGWASP
jgi:hypothetical protein